MEDGTDVDTEHLAVALLAAAGRETDPVKPERRESLRAEQKKLTRNRLLDAAVTVFAEKSFVDARMEDIAAAAGVARVTVYAHFPGKGEIVQALAGRVYAAVGEVYAALGRLPQWTRADIRTWLDDAAARWREIAPTLMVIHVAGAAALSGMARDSVKARDRYVGEHQRYAAMLTANSDRWQAVPPPLAHQRALMVVLHTESFLTGWIAAGLPVQSGESLELLTDSVCLLLGPAVREQRYTMDSTG